MENQTFRINIPFETKESYNHLKQQLYAWKAEWETFIKNAFIAVVADRHQHLKTRYLVLETSPDIINHLPNQINYEIIPSLEPVWGIAAYIPEKTVYFSKREKYKLIEGTKHFKSEQKVYPFPTDALTFDHNEIILVTGKHRDTEKFITIMQPMRRMVNWQVELITNPIVIFLMRYQIGWGSDEKYNKTLAQTFVQEMQEIMKNEELIWPAGYPKRDSL